MSELAQRLRLLQRQAGRRDEGDAVDAFAAPSPVDATNARNAVSGRVAAAGAVDASRSDTAAAGANAEPERYAGGDESLRHRQRFDTSPRTVAEARAQLAALTSRASSASAVATTSIGATPPEPLDTTPASSPARVSGFARTHPQTVRGEVSNRPPLAASAAKNHTVIERAERPTSTPNSARADSSRSASSPTPPVTVRGEVSNRPPELTRSATKQRHLSPLDTLRRLLGVRPAVPRPPRHLDRELPGNEVAPGVRLHEHLLPWPSTPGTIDLDAFGHGSVDPTRLHFFDTETTGLAGGTGTRAFMLGLGAWREGVFRVRQLTLTTLGGETAMLELFASWLAPDALLVSYNGRSYDAPLLATRYRLARRPSPLPGLPHLDLLHPTRRRYRGVWENCRLATIERELLGIVRDDDLPGSEAPRAWREWLAGGSARDLRRVGEHNRQDLVSLAQLLLRLSETPAVVAG